VAETCLTDAEATLPELRRLEIQLAEAIGRLTGQRVRRRKADWIHTDRPAPAQDIIVFEMSRPSGWVRVPSYLHDEVQAREAVDLLLGRGYTVTLRSEKFGAHVVHHCHVGAHGATVAVQSADRVAEAYGRAVLEVVGDWPALAAADCAEESHRTPDHA
jgi:hypothetical protein